jgi:hypothetical protein
MRVLKLNLEKNYFSTNFSLNSAFQCEASGQTWLEVQTRAALPMADLAIAVRTVK